MTKEELRNFLDKITIDGRIENRPQDFILNDDGYYVYWPENNNGYLDEYILLSLAAKLNKMNRQWDNKVDEYFANQPIVTGKQIGRAHV